MANEVKHMLDVIENAVASVEPSNGPPNDDTGALVATLQIVATNSRELSTILENLVRSEDIN